MGHGPYGKSAVFYEKYSPERMPCDIPVVLRVSVPLLRLAAAPRAVVVPLAHAPVNSSEKTKLSEGTTTSAIPAAECLRVALAVRVLYK